MNHYPQSNPTSLQSLLNVACATVGLPPLTSVTVTPLVLATNRGAAELQGLLDRLLTRHDELVILGDRVSVAERQGAIPTSLAAALSPMVEGSLEATRGIATHVRHQINAALQSCMDGAA